MKGSTRTSPPKAEPEEKALRVDTELQTNSTANNTMVNKMLE